MGLEPGARTWQKASTRYMNDGQYTLGGANQKGAAANSEALSRGGVRVPRIVLIEDEQVIAEMVETFLRQILPTITLLAFQNRDTAWEELQRADPDLLITDMNNHNIPGRTEYMGMSGWELLPLLAKQEVKYPILVVSGSFSLPGMETQARQIAGPKLNASFLMKPFAPDIFQQEIVRLLSPAGTTGRQLP